MESGACVISVSWRYRGSSVHFALQYTYCKLHDSVSHNVPTKDGVSRNILAGTVGPEGISGPDYVAYVFVFLVSIIIRRLYKLTPSDQTQVTLQPSASIAEIV